MLTIYKYPIQLTDNQSIEIFKEAKILKIDCQNDLPFMWAMVDTDKDKEKRNFYLRGTGHPIDIKNIDYIGTFKMRQDSLVFHLFELFK